MLGAALPVLTLAPGVAIGASPSFDCAKAASWSEKYLCRDDQLAALDRQMVALYSEARANATEAEKKAMTGDQRAWLRQREGCESAASPSVCLRQAYDARIAQLTTSAGGSSAAEQAASANRGRIHPTTTSIPEALPSITSQGSDPASELFAKIEAGDIPALKSILSAVKYILTIEGYKTITDDALREKLIQKAGGNFVYSKVVDVYIDFIVDALDQRGSFGAGCPFGAFCDKYVFKGLLTTGKNMTLLDWKSQIFDQVFLIAQSWQETRAALDDLPCFDSLPADEQQHVKDLYWLKEKIGSPQPLGCGTAFGGGGGGSWGNPDEPEPVVPGSGEPATATPLAVSGPPLGSEACKQTFHEIPIGGQACGIELTPDRRVLVGGTELPNAFQNASDVPANEIKVTVLPASPNGRYTVVNLCSYTCQRLFVVDKSTGAVQGFDAALYGPTNWIAWTDDEQYFLLQNHDDGVDWLKLVHLPEGRIDKLSSFDTDFAALMNAAESFAWLGPRRFKVALMDACMEGGCGNLEYPRDLTRVEFEIADGRLEVKSIADPSKVPAILRDALQARQTRIELADGTVLNGEVSASTLTFASSLGTVQVPLQDIQSYKDEAATLNDGSVLKGRFGEGTMEIGTSRGALKVQAKDIVAIARAKPGPAPAAGGSASPAPGQGVLTGRILDNFKKPVGNATVRILGSSLEARTDRDGRYRLNYVPGQLQVAIQAPGHDPVQFGLALSAPTEYPVEDKVLLRLPAGPGIFYWDTEGWTGLQACKLKIAQKLDGEIWSLGEQKETYKVIGTPTRIPARPGLMFLNNTESRQKLLIHRIQRNGQIVTAVQYGGLAGLDSSGPTAGVKYTESQVFQGRRVLFGNFDPGSYAIIDSSKNTCFIFHVGPDQPRADEVVETKPGTSQTLSVDGKTVSFWQASSGSKKEAYFQMESKGYRNTYKLECAGRRFLWTENVDLATGAPTGSALGAEWKPLNPKSTTANAVYDAICPALFGSTGPGTPASKKETVGEVGEGEPPVQHQAGETVTVHAPGDGFLALRSAPTTRTGKRLLKIPHGTALTLDECETRPGEGRWCKTSFQGTVGWVFDQYLLR